MAGLLIVTGPPGAGKSTVAEMLVRHWSPAALVHFLSFALRSPDRHESPRRAQGRTT